MIVYFVWNQTAPRSDNALDVRPDLVQAVKFVLIGLASAFQNLGQLRGLGLLIAAVLVTGLALSHLHRGRVAWRSYAATPLALLGGAVVFLSTVAVNRSGLWLVGGQPFRYLRAAGAREQRYQYLVVAMMLPAIAFGADAIVKRWRNMRAVLTVLLIIGIPGNVVKFVNYANPRNGIAARATVLIAPRIPIATRVPRSLVPSWGWGYVTVGWLLDNVRSGRIPSPGPLTRRQVADATLDLALQQSAATQNYRCRALLRPTALVLRKGDSFAIGRGDVNVVLLINGDYSAVKRLGGMTSWVAVADPLRLQLSPRRNAIGGRRVVCAR
jgi:hypothetical protein